jgi:hypothetical protein
MSRCSGGESEAATSKAGASTAARAPSSPTTGRTPWDIEDLTQRFRDLAGIDLDPSEDEPKVPVESLADDTQRAQFFEVMEGLLETLTPE